MFENIINFFKNIGKKEEKKQAQSNSKDAAKERLHLVLMQDRANVSADFLELMKQEIIDVIKKYIEIDEKEIDVRLTNKENEDGTNGAPALYANIPILNIKNDARKISNKDVKIKKGEKKEEPKTEIKKEEKKETSKTEIKKEEKQEKPKAEVKKDEEKETSKVKVKKDEEKETPKVKVKKDEEKEVPKVEVKKDKEKEASKVEVKKDEKKEKNIDINNKIEDDENDKNNIREEKEQKEKIKSEK